MVNALLSVLVYFALSWPTRMLRLMRNRRRRGPVWFRCVGRKDNDRSAVHHLDQDGFRGRAGGGDAVAGACLVDFRSFQRRPPGAGGGAAFIARRSVPSGGPAPRE